VGPRAVLVKRRIPSPRRESNPRTPILRPSYKYYFDIRFKNNLKAPISVVTLED